MDRESSMGKQRWKSMMFQHMGERWGWKSREDQVMEKRTLLPPWELCGVDFLSPFGQASSPPHTPVTSSSLKGPQICAPSHNPTPLHLSRNKYLSSTFSANQDQLTIKAGWKSGPTADFVFSGRKVNLPSVSVFSLRHLTIVIWSCMHINWIKPAKAFVEYLYREMNSVSLICHRRSFPFHKHPFSRLQLSFLLFLLTVSPKTTRPYKLTEASISKF